MHEFHPFHQTGKNIITKNIFWKIQDCYVAVFCLLKRNAYLPDQVYHQLTLKEQFYWYQRRLQNSEIEMMVAQEQFHPLQCL